MRRGRKEACAEQVETRISFSMAELPKNEPLVCWLILNVRLGDSAIEQSVEGNIFLIQQVKKIIGISAVLFSRLPYYDGSSVGKV